MPSFEEFWKHSFLSIRSQPRRKLLTALLVLCGIGCVAACGNTKVILVPTEVDVDGVPYSVLQLAEPIRARVFVESGGETLQSTNRVDLPAGWLLIPPMPAAGDDG